MIIEENSMGLFDLFKKKEKAAQATQTKNRKAQYPKRKREITNQKNITRML